MIQPLRRAHQRIMVSLALVVPAIFVAGLAVRQPSPPVRESLPKGSTSARSVSGELRSFENILAPDLLVYWVRAVPTDATVPPDARLLGALYGTQGLDLSEVSDGYLLAYSLPQRRVVAHVAVS
jgi:hypothetical protein